MRRAMGAFRHDKDRSDNVQENGNTVHFIDVHTCVLCTGISAAFLLQRDRTDLKPSGPQRREKNVSALQKNPISRSPQHTWQVRWTESSVFAFLSYVRAHDALELPDALQK